MRKKIENSDTRLPNTFSQTEPDIRAYTVDDIQHILKVSRTTVYELLKSKKFHSVRVGGQYRISKRALKIGSMARKEVLKMAFVNMFNDRVEQFNLREEMNAWQNCSAMKSFRRKHSGKPIPSRKYPGCFPFPKKKH